MPAATTDDVIRPESYALADSYATHLAHPDTFALPDPHQIREIRAGDHVKVMFDLTWPDDPRLREPDTIPPPGAERIWVQITEELGGCRYAGTLVIKPLFLPLLEQGSTITFSAAHIIAVDTAAGDAMTAEYAGPAAQPDFVVTEEQAIAEGAIIRMDSWGIREFRGEPVRTVSRALFGALQDAFGLAASAGMDMTEKDWQETLAERAADGQSVPPLDDLDGRTGLVPPWAVLGDLLQVFIAGARDSGAADGIADTYYATEPVKALGGQEIWLQRPRAGEWSAFLPEDY